LTADTGYIIHRRTSERLVKLLALFLIPLGSFLLAGSGARTGTNGASELLIPVGTRDIAMAGATTAMTSGPDALFANPAGPASFAGTIGLFASHMSYIADIGVDCGAVSVKIPQAGILSLYLKTISFGDVPVTTVLTPDGTGQTFRPQYFTLGLNFARSLTDRISVGVTGLLITERMAEVSATGVAFSGGVVYSDLGGVRGLSIGLAVKNIGPQMKFDGPGLNVEATSSSFDRPAAYYQVDAAPFELPSSFDLGIAFETSVAEDQELHFASSFQNNNFSDDEYKFGVEYGFRKLLFLRAGYDFQPAETASRENIFGATFGAGLHALVGSTDVEFDYAFRSARFFGANHVVSVVVGI
jgi:hypothetical protein